MKGFISNRSCLNFLTDHLQCLKVPGPAPALALPTTTVPTAAPLPVSRPAAPVPQSGPAEETLPQLQQQLGLLRLAEPALTSDHKLFFKHQIVTVVDT